MTVLAESAPPTHVPGPGRGTTLRRVRAPALVVAFLIVAAVVAALVRGYDDQRGFDPTSATHGGSQAIARLLAARGVTVHLVTRLPADPAGTVVVPDAALLGGDHLRHLLEVARTRPVVIGGIDSVAAEELDLPGEVDEDVAVKRRDPGCQLPAARIAGNARTGGNGLHLKGNDDLRLVDGCYPEHGLPTLLRLAGDRDGTLTLLGSADFLRNENLARDGDAALALGLLDTRDTVTWVLPRTVEQNDGSRGTPLADVVPRGVLWAAAELLVVAVLLALWRGRRLGPVVREPLPVVVRGVETVRGRARLYRGANARDRSALALREAARARVASLLGLGVATTPPQLVAAVAGRTGMPAGIVAALLYGRDPVDDNALTRLADDLDDLVHGLTSAARRSPR